MYKHFKAKIIEHRAQGAGQYLQFVARRCRIVVDWYQGHDTISHGGIDIGHLLIDSRGQPCQSVIGTTGHRHVLEVHSQSLACGQTHTRVGARDNAIHAALIYPSFCHTALEDLNAALGSAHV